MRNLIAAVATASLLIIPAAANAAMPASSQVKTAIAYRSIAPGVPARIADLPASEHIPPRCISAWISTAHVADARSWGAWTWSPYAQQHATSCKTADGLTIVHKVNNRWVEMAGGSSGINPGTVPNAVYRDLTHAVYASER